MCGYKAFTNYSRLAQELHGKYGIIANTFELISDYCASVYIMSASNKKYVFKLYRTFDTKIALQSANIMEFLREQSFSVVPIICTKSEHNTITISFPEGDRTGVLYEFIDGKMGYELEPESYLTKIGEAMSLMHTLMEKYDKPIVQLGKEHYVGRYINLMKEFNYSPTKIATLEDFGDILWNNVAKTKPGFCHGDLNVSNFIVAPDGQYYIFDFDCAGIAYPIKDIYCLCNMTETIFDFNMANAGNYVDSTEKLKLVRQGYEKHCVLDDFDIAAVYSFIGLGCYWSAGQNNKYRPLLEGHRRWLNEEYFDIRYNWLMQWRKLCEKI